jgi:hypothetical protein
VQDSQKTIDPASTAGSFKRNKRLLLISATGIAIGLALSSSFDRMAGGVLLLASWVMGIVALHSLGRSGRG